MSTTYVLYRRWQHSQYFDRTLSTSNSESLDDALAYFRECLAGGDRPRLRDGELCMVGLHHASDRVAIHLFRAEVKAPQFVRLGDDGEPIDAHGKTIERA